MSRPVVFTFLALGLFLVLFPLTLGKPGLPAGLKSDEPAYYLMALSLAYDRDLRLEVKDVDRAFREFPFHKVDNLIVMTDDGWRSVYFGKPYLYSLFAAPWARLAGANGLTAFNMLMLLAMVAMGGVYLSRFNPPWLALLFSAGFFLLSNAFSYVFWLHPEVFNMFGVAACLFFGLHSREGEAEPALWRLALSGAALSLAVYNKPMLALLGAPLVLAWLLRRRFRAALVWLAGAAVSLGLAAGLALALTGHPTSYLGVRRQGVVLCQAGQMPIAPVVVPPGGAPPPVRGTGGAWTWIFQAPEIGPAELAENFGYFLWGRHTGLFLYAPFTLLSLALFALFGWRDARRWGLLASLLAIALFFLLFIPDNWQGGGGFIGNRYFVNAVPAFLFLVTRIAPAALVLLGYAVGGLLLGPILFTPFGAGGPEPTLQSHVRNRPFRYFPLELGLREVPGYDKAEIGDFTLSGRRDVFLPRGERFWARGASFVELWLASPRKLSTLRFEVRSYAPGNRVRVATAREERQLDFGEVDEAGSATGLSLAVGEPDRVRHLPRGILYLYRLEVEPADGRPRSWVREMPPNSCPAFAQDDRLTESFFVGAELAFLGEGTDLAKNVYSLAWHEVEPRTEAAAGERFHLRVVLENTSGEPWSSSGSARVRLAYHWLDGAGREVVRDGRRTELPLPLASGARAEVQMDIEAPGAPGAYELVIDPVFEGVAWFSEKNPGATVRRRIEVLPAAGMAPIGS